jgi:BCD family chlorophyll transporter-like MFS transporter
MSALSDNWMRVAPRWLPFADAATPELPMGRLLRLSFFQLTVGMSAVLLIGTLNRVMIVEMKLPAWMVALLVALPLLFAPFRALIGFRSDMHVSVLGWRRVPYLWLGTLAQYAGFAVMPFALIVLSGDTTGPAWVGPVAAALAFLLVGGGMHTVQTAGLALATDLAPRHVQAKVVALLSVMLLVGMVASAIGFGLALAEFSEIRLIQTIQTAAVLALVLNLIAMWKQEPRRPDLTRADRYRPGFREAWADLRRQGQWGRRLAATGLGTLGFAMQDVLLEPYGGQVLGLSVAATTSLTALFAAGGVAGFVLAARGIGRGGDAHRTAGMGALCGAFAFVVVALSAPLESIAVFAFGTALIGFGAGLFAHGTLTACMQVAPPEQTGLALGAWGAVQATAAGVAIGLSGVLRDGVAAIADAGLLGDGLGGPTTGYVAVYLIEVALLFATLVAVGPLVRPVQAASNLDVAAAQPRHSVSL